MLFDLLITFTVILICFLFCVFSCIPGHQFVDLQLAGQGLRSGKPFQLHWGVWHQPLVPCTNAGLFKVPHDCYYICFLFFWDGKDNCVTFDTFKVYIWSVCWFELSFRSGESLQNCPYLAVWCLDPVVQMVSPHNLLDVIVHERSLSRGLPFTCPPPEQYFNPTTYNFGKCTDHFFDCFDVKTCQECFPHDDVFLCTFRIFSVVLQWSIIVGKVSCYFFSWHRCYLLDQLWNCALNLLWVSKRGKSLMFIC